MLARTIAKCVTALVADPPDGAVEVHLGIEVEAAGNETTIDDARFGGIHHSLERDAILLLFPHLSLREIGVLILWIMSRPGAQLQRRTSTESPQAQRGCPKMWVIPHNWYLDPPLAVIIVEISGMLRG